MPISVVATQQGAPGPGATPGWTQLTYTDRNDLLAQLKDLLSRTDDCIGNLEINAHGNPQRCDDIPVDQAQNFGEQLGFLRLCPDCNIYLSGCNTALMQHTMFPLPKILAMATNATVYGTVGYLDGTMAEGNARTDPDYWDNGKYHAPKPGADPRQQNGPHAYKPYTRY